MNFRCPRTYRAIHIIFGSLCGCLCVEQFIRLFSYLFQPFLPWEIFIFLPTVRFFVWWHGGGKRFSFRSSLTVTAIMVITVSFLLFWDDVQLVHIHTKVYIIRENILLFFFFLFYFFFFLMVKDWKIYARLQLCVCAELWSGFFSTGFAAYISNKYYQFKLCAVCVCVFRGKSGQKCCCLLLMRSSYFLFCSKKKNESFNCYY